MLCCSRKCMNARGGGAGQSGGGGRTSVSSETTLCLSASITCAHESRHLLEKLSFSFRGGEQGGRGRGRGGHSKPTSWYKFAKRNTGLIVCAADAGCIQIEAALKCPLARTAQWLMYNKSTKGGFNRDTYSIFSFSLQYLIGSFP